MSFEQMLVLLQEQDYSPEVNDHSITVDNFVPDMLNNNLSDSADLFKVSKHVETQVANVVFKYVSVERDFDQLNVHFWRIILWEKNMQLLSFCNINKANISKSNLIIKKLYFKHFFFFFTYSIY